MPASSGTIRADGTISNPKTFWNVIGYGNGLFIALTTGQFQIYNSSNTAIDYYSSVIATSPDGINWTTYEYNRVPYGSPYKYDAHRLWNDVIFENGKFIAVCNGIIGYSGVSAVRFRTIAAVSTDGVNWIDIAAPDTTMDWNIITYGK